MTSVEDKPLTGDEAQQFAKRELRNDLAKKTAAETYAAAIATAKYEGDYGRIMTASTPAAPRHRGAGRRRAGRREARRDGKWREARGQGSAEELTLRRSAPFGWIRFVLFGAPFRHSLLPPLNVSGAVAALLPGAAARLVLTITPSAITTLKASGD